MEMLPPAPSVVVGAAVEKRFPGYGTYRGTIEEINGGKVVVHWAATDERTRPPPPLGLSKRIYITPTPQNRPQTYFFASSYSTSTSADAIARTLFAMQPRKKPPTPSFR